MQTTETWDSLGARITWEYDQEDASRQLQGYVVAAGAQAVTIEVIEQTRPTRRWREVIWPYARVSRRLPTDLAAECQTTTGRWVGLSRSVQRGG